MSSRERSRNRIGAAIEQFKDDECVNSKCLSPYDLHGRNHVAFGNDFQQPKEKTKPFVYPHRSYEQSKHKLFVMFDPSNEDSTRSFRPQRFDSDTERRINENCQTSHSKTSFKRQLSVKEIHRVQNVINDSQESVMDPIFKNLNGVNNGSGDEHSTNESENNLDLNDSIISILSYKNTQLGRFATTSCFEQERRKSHRRRNHDSSSSLDPFSASRTSMSTKSSDERLTSHSCCLCPCRKEKKKYSKMK